MSTRTVRRNPVARVLMGVLIFQLALGMLLFWGDMRDGLRMPGFTPQSPGLTEPIRPGDQTRRFNPERAPGPGRPFPETPLPDRLILTPIEAGSTALLEGSISQGDATRIAKQLDALAPDLERIILNSPGGSVQDALELGRIIRNSGWQTEMRENDICYSACPYLLAAGV